MNLRGSDRLRVLLMGAAAVGIFGPQQFARGDGKFPMPGSAKKPTPTMKTQTPAPQPPGLLSAATAPVTLPVAQTQTSGGKKSEVQKQLELLYQQDGREMPDMNMDIQPVPMAGAPEGGAKSAPATPNNTTNAGGANTSANAPSGLRMQQPAPPAASAPSNSKPSKYSVATFFKKLMPGSKEKTTPAAADYRPDLAPLPPETNSASQANRPPARLRPEYPAAKLGSVSQPSATQGTANAAGSVASKSSSVGSQLPPLDGEARVPTTAAAASPAQALGLPPAPRSDIPIPDLEGPALPPLISQASPLQAGETAAPQSNISAAPVETPARPDLSNPFTEMSEAEADQKLEPFTGLTLEDDAGTASSKPDNSKNASVANETPAAEDPFADELRKMGITPPEAEKKPQAPEPTVQAPKTIAPPSEAPTFDGIEDASTREKMKRIHERGGMKGLKGFCPVTLRDQRELVDAKPDFHSTYRGQKFHFADADAKLKFDEDPSRYAPAAYGADVVALTRDKDVVEGSLDFAAWFKGRLYLFGAQDAHDTFVANPTLYATPVGIE